ncbi:MAG: hypothetical protein JWN34_2816 [Bryobacterales bacterium]|nr:hypothetical protein [Bryobacterales bacterium]
MLSRHRTALQTHKDCKAARCGSEGLSALQVEVKDSSEYRSPVTSERKRTRDGLRGPRSTRRGDPLVVAEGKPLSKYGWNSIARLRTYPEPSGYCVSSRKLKPRRYAGAAGATAPDGERDQRLAGGEGIAGKIRIAGPAAVLALAREPIAGRGRHVTLRRPGPLRAPAGASRNRRCSRLWRAAARPGHARFAPRTRRRAGIPYARSARMARAVRAMLLSVIGGRGCSSPTVDPPSSARASARSTMAESVIVLGE